MPTRLPYTPSPQVGEQFRYPVKRGRPFLFQVTGPAGDPLYPYLLAMHANPESVDESMTKSKTVVATRGGFVEYIWPDELDNISASGTTGAFIGPATGLASGRDGNVMPAGGPTFAQADPGRQGTMAWERFEDLLELFRCNGNIFNGQGQPVLRGRVMLIYDRGIFMGHFTTFRPAERDDKAWSFQSDWEFKVERKIYAFPLSSNQVPSVSELGGFSAGGG